jgi:hypothetical protein
MRSGGSAIRDKRSRDGVVPDVHCWQADGWCAGELVACLLVESVSLRLL